MTFSQFAGTAIIPTLARIILGVSFISLGWCRFELVEFTSTQAEKLLELGVDVGTETPTDGQSEDAVGFDFGSSAGIQTASFIQDQDPQEQPLPEQEKGQEEQPPQQDPPQDEGDSEQETGQLAAPDDATDEAAADGDDVADHDAIHKAQRMHRITLALEKRGVQFAKLIAMGVALTELVGGGLLLIGLFSRVWAFGLVCGMGAAFYFSSMHFLVSTGNPLLLASEENLDLFNRLARHLGFFVLSLSVLLAGPGPISLDRLLFKRERPENSDPDLD